MENSKSIKGVEYARDAIAMTAMNKNANARKAMAKAAIAIGNYTDDARQLWVDYLDCGYPRAA